MACSWEWGPNQDHRYHTAAMSMQLQNKEICFQPEQFQVTEDVLAPLERYEH